jgi:hypothetical protein
LFEVAANYPITPGDPDAAKTTSIPDPPPAPPVFSSIAGSSRLVLRVTDQAIPYSSEGLLAAISQLDLSVAPQALAPAPRRFVKFGDLWVSDAIELAAVLRAANGPVRAGRGRVEVGDGPTRVTGELIAAGRLRAAAANVEYRFGTEAAVSALEAASIGSRLGIVGKIELGPVEVLPIKPPLPDHPPAETHTALELPWRLVISPNAQGAFAHSPVAVEHEGRFELWHTRLGVRATDTKGNPVIDERRKDLRTVRAIWARDYEGHTDPPDATSFPDADGSDDRPQVRMSLNSRDRMMLVHETANFHLVRNRTQDWPPEAVPTNRLMLTAQGGWLDSRVQFPTLPDGGLTIEEWKHRAALGRDHEVKVVYAGFHPTGGSTRSGGQPPSTVAPTCTSSRCGWPSAAASPCPRPPVTRSRRSGTSRRSTRCASSGTAISSSTPARRTSRSSGWRWPATSPTPSPASTCRRSSSPSGPSWWRPAPRR